MVGLMGFGWDVLREYALDYRGSQEDKWATRSPVSYKTQIQYLHLKWGILRGNAKNKTSGSTGKTWHGRTWQEILPGKENPQPKAGWGFSTELNIVSTPLCNGLSR